MPEIISIQQDAKNPDKFSVKKFIYNSKAAKVVAMSAFVLVFGLAVRSVSNINNTATVENHAASFSYLQPRTIPNLNPTWNKIGIGLPFDFTVSNPSTLVGKVDYVWGDNIFCGDGSELINPSILNSDYVPFNFDKVRNYSIKFWSSTWYAGCSDESYKDINWWKQNHPDWVEYEYDSNGNLVYSHYPSQNPQEAAMVGLDISKQAVRDYQWNTFMKPALDKGVNGLSFDAVSLRNDYDRAGSYDTNGQFVEEYPQSDHCTTATCQAADPKYQADVIAWAADMYNRVQQYNQQNHRHVIVSMNTFNDPLIPDGVKRLAPYFDVWYDERGFTNWGTAGQNYLADQSTSDPLTNNLWTFEKQTIDYVQSLGKAVVLEANTGYDQTTDASSNWLYVTHNDINWILSNYLLVKGYYTYTYIMADNSGYFFDRPEYHIQIGYPINYNGSTLALQDASGCWLRYYSQGLVIVNASMNNSCQVSLNKQYKDMYGATVTGVQTYAAHTGIVLLATSVPPLPACSTPNSCATSCIGTTNSDLMCATGTVCCGVGITVTPMPSSTPTQTPTFTPTPTIDKVPLSVVITTPLNQAVVKSGSLVSIQATATGSNIRRVVFYVNNRTVCTDSFAPYQCNWYVPQSHYVVPYTLKATVYDITNSNVSYSIQVTAH